jgi:hypothetical protein
MPYCAICGRHHEPGVGCFDGTRQTLNDAQIGMSGRTRARKSGSTKQADRWIMKALLWVVLALAAAVVLTWAFESGLMPSAG